MELSVCLLQHTGFSAGINAPHIGGDWCGFLHFQYANLAGGKSLLGEMVLEDVKSFLGCLWVLFRSFPRCFRNLMCVKRVK